ncbi:aldehyde dehydrogenase (NADP(+)) [Pararobbsia alpina]|uniref:2,5-dioxovalerate dehydrogenase n=1 Tax=Pararobbsia alpina TaxID=621374 RepID=A0A6S7CI26_9BURK|nr:aldehyde dehydrogenase (NADP(+)) [Pararobbsia alpina]CAB3790461.1 Alpha-ketoglutaric semialdehyde dehydrogenase 2 [Pararobbsia alpina]
MQVTGEMLIGRSAVLGSEGTQRALNPALNQEMEPAFGLAAQKVIAQACELAGEAFDSYRNATPEVRAAFLEAIGKNILALGDTLVERVMAETGLPRPRIEGERARTVGQLNLFASVVRDGRWRQATLDSALPGRTPLPRPDLRKQHIPVGPVAVFGASNFPLAFSVAGGDTASALAAGCPVVVKAHPAHLGTSELVGRAIQKAVTDAGLHEGVFSLIYGQGNAVGEALVSHPAIRSVGFTGSRAGGMALVRLAAQRPEPIPVFAEMSSVNPVFVLPAALKTRAEDFAVRLVESLTMGVGQLCTNPGLIIALEGDEFDRLRKALAHAVEPKPAGTMLTPGIHQAYERGIERLAIHRGVSPVGRGQPAAPSACAGQPAIFETDARAFLAAKDLEQEIFGPATLLIRCRDESEMRAVAEFVEGQLTATLHLEEADIEIAQRLLPTLERKAGRILVNGFPTGVEVSYAMVHGGPFPATSDSRSTSVGASAIDRFLRPVCYQDLPAALLPEALQDANPLSLWRLRDGKLVQG